MSKVTKTAPLQFLVPWAEKIRFGLVGVANTAIDFTVLNILAHVLLLPIYSANLISTFLAMCFSLVLNKSFVFQQGHRVSLREFGLFVSVTLVGLWGLQSIVIYLLTDQFPQPLTTIAHTVHNYGLAESVKVSFLVDNGAKIVATAASLVWNYVLYKRVVFVPAQAKKGNER